MSAILGGIRLSEAAKDVLRRNDGGPMHYLAILKALDGEAIGRDPAATLLAAMGRDPGITALGGRSGMYQLAGEPRHGNAYEKAKWIVSLYAHDRWMPAAAGVDLARAVIEEIEAGPDVTLEEEQAIRDGEADVAAGRVRSWEDYKANSEEGGRGG